MEKKKTEKEYYIDVKKPDWGWFWGGIGLLVLATLFISNVTIINGYRVVQLGNTLLAFASVVVGLAFIAVCFCDGRYVEVPVREREKRE